ncbi:response regulator [Paenibacillus marinisediminis]
MIRIVIVEDQRMLRGAFASLLDLEEDMQVIGEAANGNEAIAIIERLQPDVVLMDIEMPHRSGLEVAETLKERGLNCHIIMLTTFAKPGYFERAIQAEVSGYLLKDGPIEQLTESIRCVMQGKRQIAPELIYHVVKGVNPLTDREKEILQCIAEGKSTKEIAAQLYLSSGTVRNYTSEIFSKLEVKNRIEALTKAEEKGWL